MTIQIISSDDYYSEAETWQDCTDATAVIADLAKKTGRTPEHIERKFMNSESIGTMTNWYRMKNAGDYRACGVCGKTVHHTEYRMGGTCASCE